MSDISTGPVPTDTTTPIHARLVQHLQSTTHWQSTHGVPLTPRIQRLTAPNPGVMTGPGTNSYLIGSEDSQWVVIDPGPNDPLHLERLWQACSGRLRAILCTHSHPDHSPGARPLQAMALAAGRPRPPIIGLPSGPHARADSPFQPDEPVADQALLSWGDQNGAPQHRLQAWHTPGHTANHVCWLLCEEGILFSGDHILNGSTTVIAPPDGHMGDYLASLDRLETLCQERSVVGILPAHGEVLTDAIGTITQLRAHRLRREARVAEAMRQCPDGGLDDWVALAYADVSPHLWPVARLSLQAHVDHLRTQGIGAAGAQAKV